MMSTKALKGKRCSSRRSRNLKRYEDISAVNSCYLFLNRFSHTHKDTSTVNEHIVTFYVQSLFLRLEFLTLPNWRMTRPNSSYSLVQRFLSRVNVVLTRLESEPRESPQLCLIQSSQRTSFSLLDARSQSVCVTPPSNQLMTY